MKQDQNAPIASQFGLEGVVQGLCSDLENLRKGNISVPDALARAMLAKQICNAFRLQITGMNFIANNAKPIAAIEATPKK